MATRTSNSILHRIALDTGEKSWENNMLFIRYPVYDRDEEDVNVYELQQPSIPVLQTKAVARKYELSILRTPSFFSAKQEIAITEVNTPSSVLKIPGIRKNRMIEFDLSIGEQETLQMSSALASNNSSKVYSDIFDIPKFDIIVLSLSNEFMDFMQRQFSISKISSNSYQNLLTIDNIYAAGLFIISSIISLVRYTRGRVAGIFELVTGSIIAGTLKTMLDYVQGAANITAGDLTDRILEDIRNRDSFSLTPSYLALYEDLQTIYPYSHDSLAQSGNQKVAIKAQTKNIKKFWF